MHLMSNKEVIENNSPSSGSGPSENANFLHLNESVEKAPVVKESSLQSQSQTADDSDDSYVVEDVKVCDICGDAGREEQLAVCSRCSDGAEHTYCMRVMVDKVPEGDWLCEECKLKEDIENQKKLEVETSKPLCLDEKNLNSGNAIDLKPSTKLGIKASGLESKVSRKVDLSVQVTSSRPSEHVNAMKQQALKSPSRKATLSRESSFKGSDQGRVKPINSSLGSLANNSSSRICPPPPSLNASLIQSRQLSRGTLLKSNSFTAVNSKPKTKLLQEDHSHKPKLARDAAIGERKKGHVRTVGKSQSFKSASSRTNSTLSKLRTNTRDLFGNDDRRGLKLTKEKSFTEMRNSFKTERSMITSPKAGSNMATPKAEENVSRGVRLDCDSSKPTRPIHNRGLENPKSQVGCRDLKRQSSSLSRGNIPPSLRGALNSFEREPSRTSRKEENANFFRSSDKPGRSSELSSIRSSRVPVVEAFAARSPMDVTSRTENSKVSAEVATSRWSGASRISRTLDQSDEVSMSCNDMSCEVASKDQSSTSSSCLRSLTPADAVLDEKDIFRITASVVPQYDYIWQGGFVVQRSETLLNFVDGIQAHLATSASPRVPEMVNKFPCKVLLEEVPRLTTWPSQFQDQVRDDNVALYFFARDTESYVSNYQSLMEKMIVSDLALRANFNGIELLIFPSNHLPEKSQRWNTLFYLWGVFKVNISGNIQGSQNLFGTNLGTVQLNRELPTPLSTGTGNMRDMSTCSRSHNTQEAIKSGDSKGFSFSKSSGRALDLNVSEEASPGHEGTNLQSINRLGSITDINLSGIQKTEELLHEEMELDDSRKGNCKDEKRDMELESRSIVTNNGGLTYGNSGKVNFDKSKCSKTSLPLTSSNRIKISTDVVGADSNGSREEENIQDSKRGDKVICTGLMANEEDNENARTSSEGDESKKDVIPESKSSRKRPHSNNSDMVLQASGETSTSSSQSIPLKAASGYILTDEESELKKMKTSNSDAGNTPTGPYSMDVLRTAERCFSLLGLCPPKGWKTGGRNSKPLEIISSDDKEPLISKVPDLELGLGAEKKPTAQEIKPSFLRTDEQREENKRLIDINKDEEVVALSLAFPFSKNE